jgi:hypothetical protein
MIGVANMGEPAKKLTTIPQPEVSLPPLEPGDTEIMGLVFPTQTRFGTNVTVGRNYSEFDMTGVCVRIVVKLNGTARATFRTGGEYDDGKLIGFKYRDVVFFGNGMYGAVPANDVRPK